MAARTRVQAANCGENMTAEQKLSAGHQNATGLNSVPTIQSHTLKD